MFLHIAFTFNSITAGTSYTRNLIGVEESQ